MPAKTSGRWTRPAKTSGNGRTHANWGQMSGRRTHAVEMPGKRWTRAVLRQTSGKRAWPAETSAILSQLSRVRWTRPAKTSGNGRTHANWGQMSGKPAPTRALASEMMPVAQIFAWIPKIQRPRYVPLSPAPEKRGLSSHGVCDSPAHCDFFQPGLAGFVSLVCCPKMEPRPVARPTCTPAPSHTLGRAGPPLEGGTRARGGRKVGRENFGQTLAFWL